MIRHRIQLAMLALASACPAVLAQSSVLRLPGLRWPVQLDRDAHGVPHIIGLSRHDVWMVQGYAQAQDRLFQMDVLRRQGSGTLAEILGPAALASDVQLRVIGVRRAAERSLATVSPRTREAMQAFAAGVNAWVARNPLPPEYGPLEITRFTPWTELDSLTVGRLVTLGQSFYLDIEPTVVLLTYQAVGVARGFDGTKLFFEDLFRIEPFDHATTIVSRGLLGA
jgi:penicillin amidase